MLGMPFSQLLGEFQGRTETLSDSVVAHPASAVAAKTSSKKNKQHGLETQSLMRRDVPE
jgi:hypothetical protein